MVGCNSYREPGRAGQDHLHHRRHQRRPADWGIGAGWYENEYKGYGFEFRRPRDRIGMLRETVQIVRSMWTEPETSFEGEYYPRPAHSATPSRCSQPHPPIWIGGGGEQLTLRVVARHADCANFGGKPDEWAAQARDPQGHCARRSRRGHHPQDLDLPRCSSARPRPEVEDAGSSRVLGRAAESWRAGNLVGTPEQVCEKIQTYVDLGCTGFIPWCSDYPSTETLTQ
jgi:alkanesulfonate monooxygenase SsuD/methylene tetrahydromethanopterin reductase-like flavin-dependent oxidoreductase (luciferase family)